MSLNNFPFQPQTAVELPEVPGVPRPTQPGHYTFDMPNINEFPDSLRAAWVHSWTLEAEYAFDVFYSMCRGDATSERSARHSLAERRQQLETVGVQPRTDLEPTDFVQLVPYLQGNRRPWVLKTFQAPYLDPSGLHLHGNWHGQWINELREKGFGDLADIVGGYDGTAERLVMKGVSLSVEQIVSIWGDTEAVQEASTSSGHASQDAFPNLELTDVSPQLAVRSQGGTVPMTLLDARLRNPQQVPR